MRENQAIRGFSVDSWKGGTRFFGLVANRIETTCKIVFNAQGNSILALKLIIVTQQEVVSFSRVAVI